MSTRTSMPQYRPEYQKTYVTTAATTAVFSGKGVLAKLVLNEVTAGSITLRDNGVTFAVIKIGTPAQTLTYDATIAKDLSIISSADDDFTVIWASY